MPKEHLEQVLDKFAEVTKILVETSQVKDDLEQSATKEDLKTVLERTRDQVDALKSHARVLSELFYERYDSVCEDLDKSGKSTPDSLDAEDNEAKPPTIKVVDISKLVGPKRKEAKELTPSKKVQFDSTIVIITSSDDDAPPKKSDKKKAKPKSPAQRPRRVVKRISPVIDDSSSSDDDLPIKTTRNNTKTTVAKKQSSDDERMSIEKLKEAAQLEEIEKLTNLSSLKRKRPVKQRAKDKNKKSEGEKSDSSLEEKSPQAKKKKDESDEELVNGVSEDQDDEVVVENVEDPLDVNTEQQEAEVILDALEQSEAKEDATPEKQDSDDNVEQVPEKPKDKPSPSKSSDEESKSTEKDSDAVVKNSKETINDSLLSTRLSSDSEDEFEKFKKKKDQMRQDVTSDEELVPQLDRKKRMMKKRIKRLVDSDSSDSDNPSNKTTSKGDDKKDDKSNSDSDIEAKDDDDDNNEDKDEEEEEEEKEKKKPTRKRVKRVQDSSDSDVDKSGTRKHIRQILDKDSLADTTKKAEVEERERKARIAEKQKKYNQIYEDSTLKSNAVEKIVLDFDEKEKKELLTVNDKLVKKLKPHQASGVQFMWDACFESVERAKKTVGSGCILAHCMGLGKTLQVIALAHTLLTNYDITKVQKVMVVSPLNTVLNWVNEFKQWIPDNDDYEVYELVSFKQNHERQYQVRSWHNNGGVLIIGYEMFRNLSNPENKRVSKKMRKSFYEALVDPGPDLVICDEGHLLKNEKTNISIAMNRLKTLRRIVLTGTPLQNNLKEYFCMVQFIKPNLLGTYKEYLNRFVNPITNGQYTDSTPHDIQIMRKRSHVLHKMLDGVVQRRDYAVLAPYLPPKHEYVLFLNLTKVQIDLYQYYMDHFAQRTTEGTNKTSFLFVDFQSLQRICTHPRVLLYKSTEDQKNKELRSDEDSEGSLRDFIDDNESSSSASGSSSSSNEDSGHSRSTVTKKAPPKQRLTRAQAALTKDTGAEEEDFIQLDTSEPLEKQWWQQFCDGKELDVIAHSSKLFLLFEILKECEQIGDKLLVFSQSLYSLNIIEYFLDKVSQATEDGNTDSVGGYSGSWCRGLDYFRLDGSTSCENRNQWCKMFNRPSNTRARLFLISTRAGGLGINLVAANRVIVFDVSWNPSHDIQSIYRVYRFGQTKPCYVYRFVTHGTMEMKIYERQVTKQAISKRVIDEQQIDRHYNQNDLAELYKFDPEPTDRPIPLVPKDVLLGEMLQKFEDRIYKYHEHQSLLENKEEEGLNEEERKAAWEEFENEKKNRTQTGGLATLMQSPNVASGMLRLIIKENPTLTDVQVRSLLPAYLMQMQQQVLKGDLSLYKRVQQEIQIFQAMQNQKLKEQYYQQQLMMLQQQQMANINLMNQLSQPGSSTRNNAGRPTEYIDLEE